LAYDPFLCTNIFTDRDRGHPSCQINGESGENGWTGIGKPGNRRIVWFAESDPGCKRPSVFPCSFRPERKADQPQNKGDIFLLSIRREGFSVLLQVNVQMIISIIQ